MTRLTEEERQSMSDLAERRPVMSDPADAYRIVEATPDARLAYIRFATTASRFFRGDKDVGFKGDNWKL
jgi:hypothetical protein